MTDFFNNLGGFLQNNPALAQIANNAISGLQPRSAPKVIQQAPAIQTITSPADPGMSTGMMMGIGAAVVAVGVLMVMILKRK